MPYPAYVPSCGLTPPRTGKRSAAGRSGAVPAVVPDGGIHALSGLRSFLRAPPRTGKRSAAGQDTSSSVPAAVPDGGINALSGLRSFLRAPPQDRQAQRRRAVRLHTCDSAGWRHTCLIRPTFLPAGSPPQDRQAQRRRAVRRCTCDSAGWRHQCLIRPTFLPAGSPPRTGKRSAAGRSGSIPAVVTDGGINALSGLRSFPQAHTPP